MKPLDVICFTHFHADHISGLPGLLLTLGNAERTEPITIIGPKRVEKIVNALRMIAPELPFPIHFIELEKEEESFVFNGLRINAFRVNHNIACYGYSLELDRAGKFDVNKAKEANIPLQFWSRLQKGEVVEFFGPKIETQVTTIDELFDERGEALEVARHPKQILKFKVPFKLYPNDMMRKHVK